jgi:hypothetical protein
MNTTHYLNAAAEATIAALLTVGLIAASFFIIEPRVGQAQTSGTFTISQTITGETSFTTLPTDTTLSGSLNGITGGTANGTTTVVVRTNSATGYTMDIAFATTSSGNAMEARNNPGYSIHDYPATSSQPTFLFSTASTSAVFAYTISASNASDVDASFKNNGTVCNSGGSYTADRCWMEPTFSTFRVISRSTSAVTGATSTLQFRVHVPNNPTPGLVADTYTATATLTVAAQ